MLPGLAAAAAAHRCSWSSLCRLRLRCRAAACVPSERQEWQNLVTFGSFSNMVPCSHPYFCTPSQVKLYSTNVQKEGQGSQTLRVEKVPSLDEAGMYTSFKVNFFLYLFHECLLELICKLILLVFFCNSGILQSLSLSLQISFPFFCYLILDL
ncbi:PREDICTED: zinc transporter 9-like [Hipposideros armiger]|uniref:Zinc transporter 9-like n=1 Tax=Hipposideros armiger TaxID=186990 RepID=A0A8B7QQ96_HIPAR|nr:PREDICTED: zinc transporter 9-like [Hipposideros armiger]